MYQQLRSVSRTATLPESIRAVQSQVQSRRGHSKYQLTIQSNPVDNDIEFAQKHRRKNTVKRGTLYIEMSDIYNPRFA